jgi:UDP-N-acetyl-D-glucosamine/UDP-N-acetyl-D-galactosamine dehydrogenase
MAASRWASMLGARLLVNDTKTAGPQQGKGYMQGIEKIAIVGLGYVGLPLAVEFARKRTVIGFDKNPARIAELQQGRDSTLEVEPEELAAATGLECTDDPERLREANIFIVTVPTPIDEARKPDLTPLIRASETIGGALKPGDIVIYESTVYPGATEEVCVPILERVSGLRYITAESRGRGTDLNLSPERGGDADKGFYCGYSPERINPGDREHRVSTIKKVTSGSTPEIAERVDALYREIITAGTHKASSIRVAEAAKVIENTQRDVNIALINELALIFNKLGIDTEEVLKAAGTKWNFLPFRPGLVGGHCIGVDPYYLTHKAQEIGYHPEVILAGRRINDSMGEFVAERVMKLMTQRRIHVVGSNILVLGLTFKENCPDLRNTRVTDVIDTFKSFNANVDVYDPWVNATEAQHEYGLTPIDKPEAAHYDAIILAVAHRQFVELGIERIRAFGKPNAVLFDVKYVLPAAQVDGRL